MKDNLLPDYDMANRFLDVLTGSADEAITFQFYTDNKAIKAAIPKGGKDSRAGHTHKQRPVNFAFADKKQAQGCGVWVMVNAADGKGRSTMNVVKVRALFIDLDGSPWEPAATALKPHMRVESSPERWHLYWLVEDCVLGHFKPLQQAIAKKFDGDKSCCDLPRVLRVPGFYHVKTEPVMTKLVEANNFPRYTTQQVIDGLGLEFEASGKVSTDKPKEQHTETPPPSPRPAHTYTDKATGEMVDLTAWAAQNPGFNIVKAISPQYALGSIVDGKQHIACPFAHEHTDTSPDLATFIVNADTDHTSFNIHCMHNHCADRDRLEFLQVMFEKGWLPERALIPTPLELKKPLWVTLQVKEISASTEWSLLSPDERRVAWDLQFYAWQTDDGTIEDNDWKITRFLGLSAEQWWEYRKTLTNAGWLIELNGRLTNSIVKREFDNAQIAYSRSCAGGRKGGLKTQELKRQSPP